MGSTVPEGRGQQPYCGGSLSSRHTDFYDTYRILPDKKNCYAAVKVQVFSSILIQIKSPLLQ